MRHALAFLAIVLASWLCGESARAQDNKPGGEKFVVHEWGVQVRSAARVTDHTSLMSREQLRQVLGPPAELIDGLPGFVIRAAKDFTPKHIARDWDKPVVHFYGPEGLKISFQVVTAQGRPTAYWPKPQLLDETFWMMGSGTVDLVGLKWTGTLSAKAGDGLKDAPPGHWWKTVRDVPSRYVNTSNGCERFLFYEALAVQEPLVTAKVGRDTMTIRNAGPAASGTVIMIANDWACRHFLTVATIPSGGQVEIAKADLLKADGGEEALLQACRAQWKSFGLTAEEASAVVATWRSDILNRPGMMMISRMPQFTYDSMFPVTISPKPDELVRAAAVFDTLSGQGDRLAWAPALPAAMRGWAKNLGDKKFQVRREAADELAKCGDLARGILEETKGSPDQETRTAAEELLKQLEPYPLELPDHGRGSNPNYVRKRVPPAANGPEELKPLQPVKAAEK